MHVVIKKILKTSALVIVAVFLLQFFSSTSAEAATRTWDGSTSDSWSVASNWSENVAPVTGDDLVFPSGASNLSNTNDLTENTIINSISFTGSGYTLSGNPIILGPGLAGITDSVASGGNTIALDIRLDATREIIVTNTAETLTISGRIAGVGGINKEGTGKVVLSGANTFGGILKINVGVVNAQHSTALGTIATGTEVVGGAALELQGGITISYEALALRGYGVSTGGALRNVSDSNTFGGLITLSSAGGTEIASDSGTLTLTGGMTGTFPLIIDGAGNVTYDKTPIAIAGGTITKNGAGTLRYNFPNTYTGLTTVNAGTLLYGVNNAILSGAITVTGGTLDIATYSDMVGTVTLGTLDLASGTITGSTGMLSSATWTVYNGTISAIIAGDGGALTKSTGGTVVLTRPNEYTGATTISAGVLEIQDSYALGLIDGITTVTAGATLQIDGTGLSIPEYITFSGTGHLYTGAIRNSTGNNTLTGLLTLGAAARIVSDGSTTLTIDSKGLSATTLGLTIGGAGNTTFTATAPIYGTTATLTKQDSGVLTMQAFNNFTGATNLSRGEIVLSESGAIPNTAITIGSGATLTVDNSTAAALNRLSESAALTMNGGNFALIGNASSNASESTGALTLASGHNTITITPGAGGATTMTFASLSRTAGATALFRGTSLGSAPGANVSTLMFTSTPAVLGGGGSANSTTISIIKGVFGDDSLSGTGTDMVTYNVGNTNGVRLLNSTGFSGEYASTLTANANVKLTADTVASTVSINSLIVDGYSITNPGSAATITMSSGSLAGNILMNSATSIAGANTTLGISTNHLDILTTASASISAIIGTAVAGSVAISGTGAVTLSAASAHTGTTFINSATLFAGASNVLSTGGVTVIGGTYDIGNFSESVGAVTLQNGTITGGSGVLTSTASYSLREGTVSAIIAGAVAVTRVATSAAADSVVTLTRDNTYTGATTITSGILKLGAAGGGTNTPLGTTAAGTTIAGGAALDLNGFTLGTAEAITSMTGLGYGPGTTVANGNSNMGALMNSSGTPVSYSGAITLAAASRISADAGVMTISSAISGNSALTFAGFSNLTYSGVRSGTSTIVKEGVGTLTLSSGSSSYSGATTISAGTVKIGAASVGGTNSPLGTTGGATTVALGARLDLNGFNLGIAEALTLNGVGYGLGDFASGALMNSSGSSVTYSGLITLGATGVLIKADSGDISLTAAGTISGATFTLTLGGTGSGTLASIIGTTTGTVTKIGTGTWTLSGASTYTGATTINMGTLKLGATGGTTNTPLGTAAAGTSVLSGGVLDLNGFTLANTVTFEGLTINGRGINGGGALINSAGGTKTWPGTVAQATDSRIEISSGTTTITGAVSGTFNLIIGGAGNTTLSAATGTAGLSLTKQGAGTLTVTGTNTHTGATRVEGGTLIYGATTTLAATPLTVLGGTFNMNATTDTIGTVTLIGGTISNGTLTAATSYTLESGTISAIIAGAIPVTKNTNNTVTLTGVNTISSTTTINAGTLTISGSGSAVSVTAITVNLGGTLTLDNSSTAVASRLLDSLVLTMNGGNLNFIGNGAGASSETIGQLAIASGHSVVTVTPGAGGSTTLTFGAATGFSRTAGATVLFRGTSMRSAAAANVSTLLFTNAPALTGAAGAAGTTTMSVLKGAFGDTSLSGTGSDMVTIISTKLSPLAAGEYAGDLQTANANVKLTADRAAVATNTNSLILNGFAITNPGGAITIPISSGSLAGNILINSATNIAGSNTTLGITTTELDILATANSTISAVIGTATTGSVVLSGSGNITLSATNLYTSTTFINNATLTAGASNVISSGGVTMRGGLYNLNGNSDTVGSISLTAGTITTGSGTLTGNGSFTTATNANFASIITGNLGLGANATFTIGDGLMDNDAVISAVISGAFTFAKAGTGVLELAGANSFTGATNISAGTLRLGAAGDATNTPLGTAAAGTTVTGASSALDLNGYTLGTSESLTLSGALATGALQNTSSTAVNYTGLITLGAASTIISNYGDINITNTGNITGNTFGLTIGGAGNGTLASNLNTTSGTLTKNGFGVWTVSGSSTFTGASTVSVGTLKLGAAGGATNTPLGTIAGATTVTSGAILDLNGFTLGTAEPLTISGSGIANTGAFINSSNNSVSYSGAITLAAASRVVNYGSGVMTVSGAITGNVALTIVAVGGFTQATNSVRSGTSTIIKEGSGTLILGGQNSFTGAVTVSTGILQLGAAGGATNTPLGTIAGGVTVSAGAVLDLSTFSAGGATTWEPLTIAGSGILNGGALISNSSAGSTFATLANSSARIVNNGAGTLTIAGIVTGASAFWVGGSGNTTISGQINQTAILITKYGAGTLTLSNATSTVTSLVRINAGTLAYGVNDALVTGAITIAGGTLNLGAFNETNIGAVTLIDGSIIGAGTLTSTATYTLEKGTISAVLGGTVVAAIAKNTAGRVTLSGNNTFSGTAATIAVNAGYLNLQHNNALGAAASANTTTVLGGATVELENSITIPSVKAFTVNGTGVGRVGAIRSVSGTNTIGANITLGTTNVRINSDSGTLTIPSVSGNTFNAIFGGAGTVAVTGAIATTSGSVTKHGAGTLTLTGTNTYTGPTTILEGILSANTTDALGNGSATNTLILSGGTLQAAGTITSGATRAFTLSSNNSTINTNGNSISVAGSFGGSGSLTKSGAGTLTITGTTTLGGDLTISAGTFSPTNVVFSGMNTQSIDGFTATGTMSMTKTGGTATFEGDVGATTLTINGTGGTLNLGTALTHTFSGDVTLTAGTLNGGSSTLNLSSTSATVWNGTGSVFNGGTGTVNFTGINQTLAASATTFNNLIFSGGGTKTFTSATVINGNFTNSGGTPVYAIWNSSDMSPTITLSNGSLTATNDGTANGQVRATVGVSSGKWYWETTFHRDVAFGQWITPAGISKTSELTTQYIGETAGGASWTTDTDGGSFGSKWSGGTQTTGYNTTSAWVDGDVVGMALDMDAGTITVYRNNVSLGVMYSGLSGTYYPATGSSFEPGYAIANFGATAFVYTPPNGFNAGVYNDAGISTIATGNNPITLKGNFTNTGTALNAGSSNIILDGTATQAIAGFTTTGTVSMTKTAGVATLGSAVAAGALTINGVGGTLNLGTGLTHTVTGVTTVTNGALDGGSSNLTTASVSSSNSNTRTLALGSGTWSLTGTGTVWDMSTSTGATITPGSSTIKLTDTSASAKTFAGGGNTYNNFWFAPIGGSGSLTISGNNTFNNFKDDGTAAHSILFTTGSTQSFSSWSVVGNPGQLISIDSTTTGTHNLQIIGSGSVSSDYLSIQHSVATPSGRWFAGTNSTNNQGVSSPGSGWFFFSESLYRYGGGGAGGESQNGGGGGVTGGGGGGGAPTTATGIVVQSGGVIQSVTMVVNGSGYTVAPIVSFCLVGTGGVGTAVLTGDAVTSVTIDNGGSGYNGTSIVLFGSACPTTGGGGGGGGDSE